jgi:hypothetical protein
VKATATSVTDTNQSASVTLNIATLPISVSISPVGPVQMSPSLAGGYGSSQVLTATVTNDINSAGVSWGFGTGDGGCGDIVTTGSTATTTATFYANLSSSVSAACTSIITATSNADSTKSTSVSLVVNPLAVSISPSGTQSVTVGNTLALTPTVAYDINYAGVTWSLNPTSGCGSLSSSASASGTAVTYTAPSTACSVIATATSVSDTSKSASVTINATTLAISEADIPTGEATVPFTAYISASGGTTPYTFSVTGLPSTLSISSTSGAITGTPATSGTYTAVVTVKDSSTTQQSISSSYTVNVVSAPDGSHDSYLKGQYACMVHWYIDGSSSTAYTRAGTLMSFTANGSGSITVGLSDSNSAIGFKGDQASTGKYSVGSDNRGLLTVYDQHYGATTDSVLYALAGGLVNSSNVFTEFRIAELDDAGSSPSGRHGGGVCYLQPSMVSQTSLAGGWAFGMNGESSTGQVFKAAGGVMTIGSTGTAISTGVIDSISGSGTVQTNQSISSGTIASIDATTGRFVYSVTVGSKTQSFVGYLVSGGATGDKLFMMTSAAHDGSSDSSGGFYIGEGRQQSPTVLSGSGFVNANVNGNFVMYVAGKSVPTSSSDSTAYYGELIQGTGNDDGTVTLNAGVFNDGTTYANSGVASGTPTVTIGTNGRMYPTGTNLFMYLWATNSAIVLDLETQNSGALQNIGLGFLEPQTAPTEGWTDSAIAGTYFLGELNTGNPETNSQTGIIIPASDGSVTGTFDDGNIDYNDLDKVQSGMTFNWDSTAYGSFQVMAGGSQQVECYTINTAKLVCMDVSVGTTTNPQYPNLTIMQQ